MEVILDYEEDLGGPQKAPHGPMKTPQGPPGSMIGKILVSYLYSAAIPTLLEMVL